MPGNFGFSARTGNAPFFVVEADEYDTAFFDKRAKFVHYRPRTLVLNNLEFDHADIYPDLAAIERQFHHLVRTVPGQGRILLNAADPALADVLAQGCWTPRESFAADGRSADWSVLQASVDCREAEIRDPAGKRHWLRWTQPGRHNLANALAAIAAARHAGVPVAVSVAALARFQGVRRRLERRGSAAGVTVYDDFAHHPTAIRATLAALRASIGEGERILAVLEPRSNTMRMGVHRDSLPAALAGADLCFVLQPDSLGWHWRDQALSAQTRVEDSLPALESALLARTRPGDHVLVMSNGGFGGLHGRLLEALAHRASAGGPGR